MPPKKLTPNGKAAEPAGNKATPARKKTATKAKPAASKSTPARKFIRNTRGVDVRVTFDSGRRVELSSRGTRGDMVAITKEELDDGIFLDNLGVLYEVISNTEAQNIREKQLTNASSLASPRPEDLLRSEHDKPTEFAGVAQSDAERSITIGRLNETAGKNNEEKAIEVTRSVQPERADVPGSSSLDQYGQPVSIAPLPPISERE